MGIPPKCPHCSGYRVTYEYRVPIFVTVIALLSTYPQIVDEIDEDESGTVDFDEFMAMMTGE